MGLASSSLQAFPEEDPGIPREGLSPLQAFPEKDWRDYSSCWLQVVTLCGWGT